MSRWFRHYAGMMRDEKLVRAALKCRQPIERVLWIWGAILESAAEIDNAGQFEVDQAEVAYFLRADEADVASIFDALESMGRTNAGAVVKWGDRQFQSDRSAERQRRLREKRGTEVRGREGGEQNVTREDSDGGVTAQSRHGDAPDTETDTQTEKKEGSEANASGASAPKVVPFDARTVLFRDGVPAVRAMTGKSEPQVRSLIGRWLKLTGDDASAVSLAIQQARDLRPAEPIPWLEATMKARNQPAEVNYRAVL